MLYCLVGSAYHNNIPLLSIYNQ